MGRPGLVLYRRIGELSDAEAGELARFSLRHADAIAERAPFRPGDGLRWLAFLAASAQREAMFDVLVAEPGGGLLTTEEIDELTAFWAYAEKIRDGEDTPQDPLGPLGRIREQPWLRRRGHTASTLRRYELNAYRFLDDLRVADGRPSVLEKLPAFTPAVTWQQATAAAIAAALLAAALFFVLRRDSEPPVSRDRVELVSRTIIDGLPDGELVLGARDGRWWIVDAHGATVFAAPEALRLSSWVEGGAVGDLTGDGVAEVVLYSSAPTEAKLDARTGVWVFARASNNGHDWRLLARLPAHPGRTDAAACEALRLQLISGEQPADPPGRRRALQDCPQRISQVSIVDGELHAFQLHYGRQHLRTRCLTTGCDPFERVLAVDSDVTSALHARGRWILATSCWSEGRALGYGVIAEDARFPRPLLLSTAGRTVIAPRDDRTIFAVVGEPCDGLAERALVAGAELSPAPGTSLSIVDITEGAPQLVERMPLQLRTHDDPWLASPRGPQQTRWAAIIDETGNDAAPNRLRVVDDRGRISPEVPTKDIAELKAIDLDHDGIDEVVVGTWYEGLRVFRLVDGPRLIEADFGSTSR